MRTKAQREEHLRLMERSLLEGLSATETVRAAAAKFGIVERQAWRDLQEVQNRWKAAGIELKKHSEMMLAQAVRRREHVYRTALQAGDRKGALEAEVDRCKLLGLYPAQQTRVQHDGRLAVTGGDGGPVQQVVLYLPLNGREPHDDEGTQAGYTDDSTAGVGGEARGYAGAGCGGGVGVPPS